MFNLCFRMCHITLDVQFVFQNVSDCSLCSVCVSECVRSLLMFSLCFRMCQIMCSVCVSKCVRSLDVQFVFQNVSDHSICSVCVSECVGSLLMFTIVFQNVSDHS